MLIPSCAADPCSILIMTETVDPKVVVGLSLGSEEVSGTIESFEPSVPSLTPGFRVQRVGVFF